LTSETEIELARDLMAGKPEAFDRFVDHFRSKLFQYTFLMCGHREDAEEVAQETLLKVFENFEQLREPGRVKAWLFRIARNACLMKRRKSVFAPAQELSLDEFLPQFKDDAGPSRPDIADWSNLPEERVLQSELRDVLRTAIQELPETYRAVVLLRDIEELSTEEAAHILDVGPDVVKTRLHRARLAIRQKLDVYLKAVRV
jgi:RNA polymerase sigma-70 factor (ECF subfamily)